MGTTTDLAPGAIAPPEPEIAPEPEVSAAPAKGVLVWVLALSSLVIVLAAAAIALLLNVRGADAADRRDALVVETAREVVVNLTTLDFASADADIERILAGTSGAFREQFASSSSSFREVLERGEVASTGEIREAGLVRADGDSAEVLLAVTSMVKNTDIPGGEGRVYRMKASLERAGDAWLVSDVEFVS
ncbi:hypothetical protein [Tomitella biformata]|uniref:hypothetical protein n=1 Tax=Tomitella biformata TaxID=630403 RepID=UPI000463BD62|nr:hypothetical protein [Tomitella biformata]